MNYYILTTNHKSLPLGKLLLSLFFIFLINSAFSQKNRTYIGFDYYPTVATQLNSTIAKPNSIRYSPNFCLNMHHEFNKRKLYFEYGIKHINRGYGYKIDVINIQGIKFGDYKHQIHNDYISMPLSIGLKINKLYIEFGPSIDYLYSTKIFTKGKWTKLPETDKKLNFSGNMSFGTIIEPKYMKSFLFSIGAYANFTLTEQYLNVGLEIGLKYRLKKRIKSYRRN